MILRMIFSNQVDAVGVADTGEIVVVDSETGDPEVIFHRSHLAALVTALAGELTLGELHTLADFVALAKRARA